MKQSLRELSDRNLRLKALTPPDDVFRLLVESVNEYAISLLDCEGRVSSWNSGAERSKGYRADEIIGRHFSCFYPEDDIQQNKPEQELRTARQFGRSEDEGWRIRKDGSRFWANVTITAIYDPPGTLMGYAKITKDLTRRKETEDRIRILNEQLELRNTELSSVNKELDLSRMADDVVSQLCASDPNRTITCNIMPGLSARGDRLLVQVVLENLLGNAWKFTPKRQHGVLELSRLAGTAKGDVFYIRDNGAGFDMKYADKSSACFSVCTPRMTFQERASGSLPCRESSTDMAARSGRRARWTTEQPSTSPSAMGQLSNRPASGESPMGSRPLLLVEDNSDDEALTLRALHKNNIKNGIDPPVSRTK